MVSTTILLNSGVYRLFGTPFSIAKHPHLFDSISYRLTNGVQFKEKFWGDFDFPPDAPLKRPKEGLRPFLWKPSRGYGGWEVAARRGMRDAGALLRALRRALGRGTGCLRSFRALRLAGDEADDSPVDVEPALGAFIAPALCVFPVFL